jgi:hypothetical protein
LTILRAVVQSGAKENHVAKKSANQVEMFQQKRIPAIETQSKKYDDARAAIEDLKGVMANAELKLGELLHIHAADVDHQEDRKGCKLLVYERGNYRAWAKQGKESIGVAVAKSAKGAGPEDAEAASDDPEEGGE